MDYATDEERVEELKKWWKENGKSVIFGIVLGLSILFGWRWWQDYQLNQSVQASALYNQLELSIQQNKPEQADALSEQITKQYENQTYTIYAALAMAKMKMDAKDVAAVQTYLQWGLDHVKTPELKHLLVMRLARVFVSVDELDKAFDLLQTTESTQFASSYEELKGDILVKKGNTEQALLAYQKAALMIPPGMTVSPALQYKMDDLSRSQ